MVRRGAMEPMAFMRRAGVVCWSRPAWRLVQEEVVMSGPLPHWLQQLLGEFPRPPRSGCHRWLDHSWRSRRG